MQQRELKLRSDDGILGIKELVFEFNNTAKYVGIRWPNGSIGYKLSNNDIKQIIEFLQETVK